MRRSWPRSPTNAGRPRFTAVAAMTLDGKIALHHRHATDWTSREDKVFLRRFLDTQDVILVGRNTYETAWQPLAKRNCIVLTRSVVRTVRRSENLRYCNPQRIDIAQLVSQLGYRSVAVLGGTFTYTYCLQRGLLDVLYLTIEPLLFGRGLPLVAGKLMLREVRVASVRKLNRTGTLLLRVSFPARPGTFAERREIDFSPPI